MLNGTVSTRCPSARRWSSAFDGTLNTPHIAVVVPFRPSSPSKCAGALQGELGPDKVPSNQRLKLSACGRRLRRNAQGKPFILIAAPASRSLSAIR
jgi:hypothetical protein